MRRNKFIVLLILFIWFVISFVTNILGPIMPAIIENYKLSLTMAAFLPFSFFMAYGVMSIPAGIMIEKLGEKNSMIIALSMNFAGSLLFALLPIYTVALASLFIIGIGMAMLQVIINPLMREAGGEENFAFYAVLAQLVFGAASFVSPIVYTRLIALLKDNTSKPNIFISQLKQIIPENLEWISLYWIFAFIFIIVIIIVALVKLPKVELKEDEKSASLSTYINLIKNKEVILFLIAIMAYVGTEQGLANWMSEYLRIYHNLSPQIEGASTISMFWGLMSLGCIVGLVLLKVIDSQLVLKIFTTLSIITLCLALFSDAEICLIAFPLTGFFISVMFSIIFSLALNSVKSHHGALSGILCSGIFGGALIPLIIGFLGDIFGLKIAMLFLFISLSYIMWIAFWAKPLIKNKLINIFDN